jgi:predicted small metal-binding protein
LDDLAAHDERSIGRTLDQRRRVMAKVLRCGDLMPGCNTVLEGKDVAEVMAKGAEHAKKDHGINQIPPDMVAKVQAAIKDT